MAADDHYRTADFFEAAILMCLGATLKRVDRRSRGVAVLDVSSVTRAELDRAVARMNTAFASAVGDDGKATPEILSIAVGNSPLGELGGKYVKLKNRVL